MKRFLKSIFVSLPVLFSFPVTLFSQNITGIWRGNFFSDRGDQYKIEVQLESKGNTISGVTYSYLTTIFYGKATMTGHFNKLSQKVLFEEIKTVELKMSGLSVACIMKYNLIYTRSGKEEFLEGTYSSKYEKDSYGGKKGEPCGDGRVYLRKVPTSDFPVEPFLKNKTNPTSTVPARPKVDSASIKKTTTATVKKPTTTPPKNTVVVKPKPQAAKTNTVKTNSQPKPANPVTPLKKTNIDSLNKAIPKSIESDKQAAKNTQPKISTPQPTSLSSRKNELVNTFTVDNENVTVKLYDNGEIDGDTISVYMNNKLVLSKKRLTAAPLELKLKLDEINDEHELIMVAENLGRIPPNTSLMIVEAGDQRFTARITSTYQKNAMVKFKFIKK
jgi:hypothetical protein